jgi:hypothetical protein
METYVIFQVGVAAIVVQASSLPPENWSKHRLPSFSVSAEAQI